MVFLTWCVPLNLSLGELGARLLLALFLGPESPLSLKSKKQTKICTYLQLDTYLPWTLMSIAGASRYSFPT